MIVQYIPIIIDDSVSCDTRVTWLLIAANKAASKQPTSLIRRRRFNVNQKEKINHLTAWVNTVSETNEI